MSTAAVNRYSVAEYLALERDSDVKHEFFDGELFAMAGGSRSHHRIIANCIQQLSNALEDSPCEVFPSDMRVKLPTGLYAYPDVSVVCSEPRFEGDRQDVLLNPLVIVEVLSPSTEADDRGTKFAHYGQLPSLREYVLVSQDRMNVEHFSRSSADEDWVFTRSTGTGTTAHLAAIDRSLVLSGISAKVELDSQDAAAAPPPPNDETRPR